MLWRTLICIFDLSFRKAQREDFLKVQENYILYQVFQGSAKYKPNAYKKEIFVISGSSRWYLIQLLDQYQQNLNNVRLTPKVTFWYKNLTCIGPIATWRFSKR